MENNKSTLTNIVAIGIGAAVFFILGRFLSIPTGIPNTSFETTYPFLALMGVIYGPVVAGLVAFLGHAIKDLMTYGLWWSWVIASGVTGLGYGLIGRQLKVESGIFDGKEIVKFIIGVTIVNLLSWAVIAPGLDILIYSEPANKVFLQGLVSAGLNSIAVAVLGTVLIKAYASTQTQSGSLTRED
ncbi:ECF-type riboflavin transporter substrate-binding protein [Aerococcaceae bacterium DSM 111020]|nr:ECF-type riboflavin transporter substrate-binding protein [Aerococcaceae bacterium DSM 111020]